MLAACRYLGVVVQVELGRTVSELNRDDARVGNSADSANSDGLRGSLLEPTVSPQVSDVEFVKDT